MTDSRTAWLESLDPEVRAEVEAEIADYESGTTTSTWTMIGRRPRTPVCD